MADSTARRRVPEKGQGDKSNGSVGAATATRKSSSEGSFGVVDILRILGGLFLLNCLLSYFITNDSVLWGWRPWFVRPNAVAQYFVSALRSPANDHLLTDCYSEVQCT